MSNFFSSVKADLLGRRMLPILVIVGVALVGALAYAVLGGGSSASTSASVVTSAPSVTKVSGIAVSQAQPNAEKPVAETTSGSSHRAGDPPRNPFTPLPSTEKKAEASAAGTAAAAPAPETAGSGSSASEPAPSSQGRGGSSNSGTNKSSGKKKPKTIYQVAVLFGTAPAGTPVLDGQLTPYENLKRQQPLPDSKQPLIVYRGVIAGGKSATFTLVGEAILRGNAACLPSASQCLAIDLKPGQTEELEYIPLGSAAVVYQLQVVSITSTKASASAASRSFHGESKSGLALLRHAGLTALPGLRYSDAKGVLVFAGHRASAKASAARAHTAAWADASVWGTHPKL
jgi:hypothetical protein